MILPSSRQQRQAPTVRRNPPREERMSDNKKALVTGGATGIGRSAALALARAGYDVAINYASSAKAAQQLAGEVEALGRKTLLLQCDVADDAAVRAMLGQV